jgi:hypothetical protein
MKAIEVGTMQPYPLSKFHGDNPLGWIRKCRKLLHFTWKARQKYGLTFLTGRGLYISLYKTLQQKRRGRGVLNK